MQNANRILSELVSICEEVGRFQLGHFNSVKALDVKDKGLNQLVSFVDIESEKLLVKGLKKLLPNAGFITEEGTEGQHIDTSLSWIIDPLDGTTNFIHGLPAFSISVALMEQNEIMLGVVYIPVWNESFTAIKGKGAFLNGNKIQCSAAHLMSSSLIATGFPYYEFKNMQAYLAAFQQLMQSTHGLRRIGSAAIDMAYTACGRFDGFFELGLNVWDIAAGALLVKESGGIVSDFIGGDDYLFGKNILASSPKIYSSFREIISSHIH